MTYPILDSIRNESDIKQIPEEYLPQLCEELRTVILETVSQNGGHLASSLGAVELIVALHRVLDLPSDKIIFDVGHQSYAHKILTGRKEVFSTLRKQDGISGFPKREESIYDSFNTGHASTSVSAGLGILRGQTLNGDSSKVVCLIGDGALTGGLAYEALDDAGESKLPLIVVLNDNEMSISHSVGALSRTLSRMRTSRGYTSFKKKLENWLDHGTSGRYISKHLGNLKNRVKRFILSNTFFEELGLKYLGPIDGHNVHELIQVLSEACSLGKPVLVHTITKKGKGYSFAEKDPQKFHGVGAFDIKSGELLHAPEFTCSDVFAEELCKLAADDERICAITAAMPQGTGLDKFEELYPKRFFDVGIAEEHAVTMAAGLAVAGKKPVIAIYSSFLQRAVDEVYHDVCLQNLPVVFSVDRAGLVGRDGETHNGLLDPALFNDMPNLEIFTPSNYSELRAMLAFCIKSEGPSLIRYNRGTLPEGDHTGIDIHRWTVSGPITKVCVVSYGDLLNICKTVISKAQTETCLIGARTLKPLDDSLLKLLQINAVTLIVAEEGPAVLAREISLLYPGIRIRTVSIKNIIVQQGTVQEQRVRCGINAESIEQELLLAWENEK